MKRILDPLGESKVNITGDSIRKAREAAGLTQQQLSARLETLAVYVCRGSISRIENGSRVVTDIELQGLATVLHVPIESFFSNSAEP